MTFSYLPKRLSRQFTALRQRLIGRRNLKSFLTLNLGALFTKATGFVRQPLLLAYLGREQTDYLLAGDRVGQLLTLLFVGGTLYSAVLPQLVSARQRSGRELREVISWFFLIVTLGLALATGGLVWQLDFLLSHWLKADFLARLSPAEVQKFYFCVYLLLISPFLFAYQSLIRAYLSLLDRYKSAALVGGVTNVIVIGSVLWSGGDYLRVAYGLLTGFGVSTLIILYEGFLAGFSFQFGRFSRVYPYLVNFTKNALPRTLIVDSQVLGGLILVAFVNFEGQLAAVEIWSSILGAFAFVSSAYLTVIFPQLATYHSLSSEAQNSLIRRSFRNLCRVGKYQVGLSIFGGLGIFFLYDLVFGLEFKNYLSLLLICSVPTIVCRLFTGYLQQILFALEDNFVILASLLANGLLVLTTYGLNRVGLDAGVALILGLNVGNITTVYLITRYLRTRYGISFR